MIILGIDPGTTIMGFSVIKVENNKITLLEMNVEKAGRAMRDSFEAQIAMFPNMVTPEIMEQLDIYKPQVKGWKLSGAGGGGYLILFNDAPVENAIQIRIRR